MAFGLDKILSDNGISKEQTTRLLDDIHTIAEFVKILDIKADIQVNTKGERNE